jgi:uncharacterized protein YegL
MGIKTIPALKKNKQEIIDEYKKYSDQTKKTIYSALSIITNDSSFEDERTKAIQNVNTNYSSKRMSEKQEKGKITKGQIKETYQTLIKIYVKRPSMHNLTNVLIVGLICGAVDGIVPRRL